MYRYFFGLDARGVLPLIRVPTLVLRRAHMPVSNPGVAHHLADNIAGARYVETPGSDVSLWAEGAEEVQDLIREFLTGAKAEIDPERVLATVLFTDIVSSTERAAAVGDRKWKAMLDEHDRTAKALVDRFRGSTGQDDR